MSMDDLVTVPFEGAFSLVDTLKSGQLFHWEAYSLGEVAGFADDADDPVTNDMMMDCLKFHEKAIWMLRAIVSK